MAALFVAGAAAADVDGKWTGRAPGRQGDSEVTFNFKADGGKLSGTIANAFMGNTEILDGRISGDEITFKQVLERGERKITFKYKGTLKGDEIEFTRELDAAPGGPGGAAAPAGGTSEDKPQPDGASAKRGGGFGRPVTFIAKRAS
jgi:hypothetical protein